ncbi:MAG: ATP-binding protein, partial [Actinomycetota bacterium]|nr:ATP-binding protein [Actinomycetota bacterium]
MARELRERSRELRAVEAALDDAARGRGRVVVVEGDPGIGKTSLVAAALERAEERGMRVLAARGSELERAFAFGVVRQLVEPLLYRATRAQCERWFAGAAALARPLFENEVAPDGLEAEEEVRFRRRHGLYWLVANLARDGALLLAVDDLQWVDDPSLGFLRHLAMRIGHLPAVLLVATRAGAAEARPLIGDP